MPQHAAEDFDRSYSIKSSAVLQVLCAATVQFKYRFNCEYRRSKSHRRLYAATLSDFGRLVLFMKVKIKLSPAAMSGGRDGVARGRDDREVSSSCAVEKFRQLQIK